MTKQEAIDIIKCLAWHTRPNEEDVEQAIKALEQEPKTGHWIGVETLDSALWHECSECGETEFYATDYCSNCGAKMEDEE